MLFTSQREQIRILLAGVQKSRRDNDHCRLNVAYLGREIKASTTRLTTLSTRIKNGLV